MIRLIPAAIHQETTTGKTTIRLILIEGFKITIEADTLYEAYTEAEQRVTSAIVSLEDQHTANENNLKFDPNDLNLKTDEQLIYLKCDTMTYRNIIANKCIRKSVSVPAWLNTAAEEANINFSAVLQRGLRECLGFEDEKDKMYHQSSQS